MFSFQDMMAFSTLLISLLGFILSVIVAIKRK